MNRFFVAGVLLSSLGALVGCGTPHSEPAADKVASAKTPGVVCETVKPLGTNRQTRVCRSTEQAEQERRDAGDDLRRTQQNAAGLKGGS